MYLIRHGATKYNVAVPPRLQGQRIVPGLSAEGQDQAARTGHFLATWTLDAVFASPMLRARQTAGAVAGPHGLEVQIVPELIEVDVGCWEGRSWDEAELSDPAACQAFLADPVVHPYLDGENLQNVRDRVVPAFERLLTENVGRSIAVVAHNMVNRVYLADLMHIPLGSYRILMQDNCGVNLLRHRAGHTRAVTVNSVFHLRAETG
jgi:broad specificity phosphatase PhoE